MTSDPSLKLRVARLENETESIYELITDVRTTQLEHTQRLDRVETRLDGVETRLGGVETRLEGVEIRLDGVETKLDEVLRRLPESA